MRTVQLSSHFPRSSGDLGETRFATQTRGMCRGGKGECGEEKAEPKQMLASAPQPNQ